MTLRNNNNLFLYALAILLATGCENVSVNFLPLAAGNTWHYKITQNNRPLRIETIKITKELPPEDDTRKFHVQEPNTFAVWIENNRSIARATKHESGIIINHPPFVNSGWKDYTKDGRIIYSSVISRGVLGKFTDVIAIKRQLDDFSLTLTQWYAAGVGMIKWESTYKEQPPITGELIEYELQE